MDESLELCMVGGCGGRVMFISATTKNSGVQRLMEAIGLQEGADFLQCIPSSYHWYWREPGGSYRMWEGARTREILREDYMRLYEACRPR